MQNPSPQYIKDATIFLEHEVLSGLSWVEKIFFFLGPWT